MQLLRRLASMPRPLVAVLAFLLAGAGCALLLLGMPGEGKLHAGTAVKFFLLGVAALALALLTIDPRRRPLAERSKDEPAPWEIVEDALLRLWKHWWDFLSLLGLGVLYTFLAYLVVCYSLGVDVNPQKVIQYLASLALGLVGVVVSAVGMHYAFQAQVQARKAEEEAKNLLTEKAFYLEGFDGFLRRIDALTRPGGAVDQVLSGDEMQVNIKCVFLTPFLGHAGISKSGKESGTIIREFKRVSGQLFGLTKHRRARVKLLALSPEAMAWWYAQVLAVGASGRAELSKPDAWDAAVKTVKDLLPDRLYGSQSRVIEHDPQGRVVQTTLVDPFNNLVNELLIPATTQHAGKLRIRCADGLPFQLFLVYGTGGEENDGEVKDPEHFQRTLITYVGSNSYAFILDRLRSGKPTGKGMEFLLKELHACHSSEDPRICRMLSEHFENLWAVSEPMEDLEGLKVTSGHINFERLSSLDLPFEEAKIDLEADELSRLLVKAEGYLAKLGVR